jgi:hypothetical protein
LFYGHFVKFGLIRLGDTICLVNKLYGQATKGMR